MDSCRVWSWQSAPDGLYPIADLAQGLIPLRRMAKARKRTDSASVIDQPGQTPETTGQTDSRDRIAMRAYELYLARGGGDGMDFDDWLAAEREIGGSSGNASRGDAGE